MSAWLIEQIFIGFRPQNYQQTAVIVQPSSAFDKNILVYSRKSIALVCCTLGYSRISDGGCVVTDPTKRGEGVETTNKGAQNNSMKTYRYHSGGTLQGQRTVYLQRFLENYVKSEIGIRGMEQILDK